MKKLFTTLSLLCAAQAYAGVSITDCVIVEPAPGVNKTGLFFNATFTEDEEVKALRLPSPEAILGAEIPELTNEVQMHNTIMQDGVMKMQRFPKLFLKKNTVTKLERGGTHFMLMDLKKRPLAGEKYTVNLWLTYLSDQQCEANVLKSSDFPPKHKM
ncbi:MULTISPECIES: copper chaperone PCu(A)C [Vibrio harveyi group]|uniref:copper chaperone PCu(A)C n=1 Tax=Vibrio harveyi group TaxID=717610 RepID=UPI0009BD545B|nr:MULTISPECIES: copper chaperone PCu(A)C [Vibrio harveyi group]MCR9910832.1 copper chaperone PCu(A)C [Vibrio campbellii]OQQ02526.1 hypothetical protein BK412_14755 [Vibrio campbellii]TMX56509.1 copper chaperone PCu(A)C [Vibrio rotiferianus]